jgi:hypothetical protein
VSANLGFLSICYTQCEQIEPAGVRPLRGPLRWAFERVRDELRLASARAAAGGVRARTSSSSSATLTNARVEAASAIHCERPTVTVVDDVEFGAALEVVPGENSPDMDAMSDRSAAWRADTPSPTRSECESLRGARDTIDAIGESHLSLGVSLACLREFARTHGVTEQQTTAGIVALVREETSASRLSFAEQRAALDDAHKLASDGAPAVGRASVFVSHAQACQFLKMLDALDAHVAAYKLPRAGTYFWCVRASAALRRPTRADARCGRPRARRRAPPSRVWSPAHHSCPPAACPLLPRASPACAQARPAVHPPARGRRRRAADR